MRPVIGLGLSAMHTITSIAAGLSPSLEDRCGLRPMDAIERGAENGIGADGHVVEYGL